MTASVDALRELLERFHKISIERRWFFQCVRDMLDAGLISRQPRHLYSKEDGVRQIPSMIAFTMKGAKWLVSKNVVGARKLLRRIVAWVRGKDARFPRAALATEDSASLQDEENLKRLRRLVLNVG